jgi:hypothetical protein
MRSLEYKQRIPLPVKLLYILLALPFVIYIPISFFHSAVFLLVLDLCLMLALLLTMMNMKAIKRVFAGRASLFFFIVLYVISILTSLLSDLFSMDVKMLTIVRNLLFGIVVFVISSIWINTQRRVDIIINILLWGSFFAALYGIRQLLFGFTEFELDRLSMMGSSLAEMETLGRIRITSTFGDPLTFAFFMMIGVFVYFIARSRKISNIITRNTHPFIVLIIFLALVLSLTRAPLLGLICGAVIFLILKFKRTRKDLVLYIIILIFIILGVVGLYSFVTFKVFADSNSSTLVAIHNAASSFWSLFQMSMGSEIDPDTYFLVAQSKDDRAIAWHEGLSFLYSNPLGGGLSNISKYSFVVGDVGILSLGLKIGIVGMIAMISIFLLIGVRAWFDIRRIPQLSARNQGYVFISIWIAIIVTNGISSLIDSSVNAIVIWTIAGILVNQKRIYMSGTKQPSYLIESVALESVENRLKITNRRQS